jgi:hypothetical protein
VARKQEKGAYFCGQLVHDVPNASAEVQGWFTPAAPGDGEVAGRPELYDFDPLEFRDGNSSFASANARCRRANAIRDLALRTEADASRLEKENAELRERLAEAQRDGAKFAAAASEFKLDLEGFKASENLMLRAAEHDAQAASAKSAALERDLAAALERAERLDKIAHDAADKYAALMVKYDELHDSLAAEKRKNDTLSAATPAHVLDTIHGLMEARSAAESKASAAERELERERDSAIGWSECCLMVAETCESIDGEAGKAKRIPPSSLNDWVRELVAREAKARAAAEAQVAEMEAALTDEALERMLFNITINATHSFSWDRTAIRAAIRGWLASRAGMGAK